jgi:hypothetical protein
LQPTGKCRPYYLGFIDTCESKNDFSYTAAVAEQEDKIEDDHSPFKDIYVRFESF